jgi:SAM-dependent methyltransferase
MRLHPEIDKDFRYVSPFLKRVVSQHEKEFINQNCLDIPCGNGRNTFFLAGHFKNITAVDISKRYLEAIDKDVAEYAKAGIITTINSDILEEKVSDISGYKFICNVHFFNVTFLSELLKAMREDAILLIETPGCHGSNYKILPTREEINELFADYEILYYEFKECKHIENAQHRGILKTLIKK